MNIFICESQPIVIEGLIRVLERTSDIDLSGHAADLEVAVQQMESTCPAVFLLGQPPNAKSVLPLLSRARQAGVSAPIIVWVSELSDMDSFRALQMGARGVVTRTQPVNNLLECVRVVARGEVWLKSSSGEISPRSLAAMRITPRERQILELVCEGLRNREIAERMSITPGTVKVHLMHIFEKTGVKDRFQLALQGRHLLGASERKTAAKEQREQLHNGIFEG